MALGIDIHTEGKLRVSLYMPDNGNSLTLECGGGSFALFGLSRADALAMFDLFRDERSRMIKGAFSQCREDAPEAFDAVLAELRETAAPQVEEAA